MKDILNLIWLLISYYRTLQDHAWSGESISKTVHEGPDSVGNFSLPDCDVGIVEWCFCYGVKGHLTTLAFLG